jgi:hypothetical protein
VNGYPDGRGLYDPLTAEQEAALAQAPDGPGGPRDRALERLGLTAYDPPLT